MCNWKWSGLQLFIASICLIDFRLSLAYFLLYFFRCLFLFIYFKQLVRIWLEYKCTYEWKIWSRIQWAYKVCTVLFVCMWRLFNDQQTDFFLPLVFLCVCERLMNMIRRVNNCFRIRMQYVDFYDFKIIDSHQSNSLIFSPAHFSHFLSFPTLLLLDYSFSVFSFLCFFLSNWV